jgi:hypothetical protein
MFRVIVVALIISVVLCATTDCNKVVSSISSAKMMIIKNTNPKLKFLADETIADISKTKKIPVQTIKRCTTIGYLRGSK